MAIYEWKVFRNIIVKHKLSLGESVSSVANCLAIDTSLVFAIKNGLFDSQTGSLLRSLTRQQQQFYAKPENLLSLREKLSR